MAAGACSFARGLTPLADASRAHRGTRPRSPA